MFMPRLFFGPEDEGDVFHKSLGVSRNYTALQHSSLSIPNFVDVSELCKIRGFHDGDYEECHNLLGCGAV
jgi:hypothetical protein